MPTTPTKGSAQNGVGCLKMTLTVWSSTFSTLDAGVGAARRGGGRRIGGVFPVEDDVVGGEGLAVVPFHAALELPGDRGAVG